MFFIKFLISLIVIYIFICILAFFLQARLMYFPMKHIFELPSDYGIKYEDIKIKTKDNILLHSWWIPHEQNRGVVLVCHGNGGNVSHRLHLVNAFQSLGFSTFLFDYRGYGHSKGKPSEKGTYLDAEAAYNFLINNKQVDPKKIVVYGESLGSAVAIELATRKEIGAIILEGSFTSVPDVAAESYFFLPVRWFIRYQYNSLAKINTLSIPILFIHSPEDDIISFKHGKKLFDAYNGEKEFLNTSGGHNDGGFVNDEKYLSVVQNFLNNNI